MGSVLFVGRQGKKHFFGGQPLDRSCNLSIFTAVMASYGTRIHPLGLICTTADNSTGAQNRSRPIKLTRRFHRGKKTT
jgi:hypothetical protein